VDARALTCDEIEELLPEYALGVLSVNEAADVARHLGDCARHTASLDAYEAVCSALSAGVPLVDPPDRLRARLLARVARPPAAPRRVDRGSRISWAVTALAVALAIVFGVWGLSLQGRIDSQDTRQQRFIELATQPGAHMVLLDAAPVAGGAKAVLIYTGERAAVWAVGLPALEDDQVYQCWWLGDDGQPVNAGSFRPLNGVGVWFISMSDRPDDFHTLGVTLEPDGESDQPQGPRVLEGEF
jgi:anti-sigma-K factor RskA